MRTEALVLALVLTASRAQAQESRFEVALPVEVTLIGLTAGVRPEVLFRPGEPGTVSRLRLAIGVLGGPDQLFVPVSLGYRAVFRQEHVVQPTLGLGLEVQHRAVFDFPLVQQFGLYVEAGCGFAVTKQLSLGAMLAVDVMFLGGPGLGIGPRLWAGWRF
ncbi:MAG: hypothetical protein ACOZQL_20995 [Myxococcota bacterium]